MSDPASWSFATRRIRAGAEPGATTGSRVTPIYQGRGDGEDLIADLEAGFRAAKGA